MLEKRISRRGFMGKGVVAVGAVGLAGAPLRGAVVDPKGVHPKGVDPKALAIVTEEPQAPKEKILSHDERMEYRRLGKTNLMVSAVSLGGHWKRLEAHGQDFDKNRADVVAKCIDSGINYVDACTHGEGMAYSKALKAVGKRDKMYFGFSFCEHEMRNAEFRRKGKLLEALDDGLKQMGFDYVDIWRVTCHEPGRQHTFGEAFELIEAGEKAVKDGKCRFFGVSSHDREWLDLMIRSFPILSVVLTPYTANSKEKPKESLFESVRKCDVGIFGIKPFASNSLFKGNSQPGNPHEKEDNEKARLALRYVLTNDAITAPIPGLIDRSQVDNCLEAIAERRKLDLQARAPAILEDRRLAQAAAEMWERLPPDYQWLKDWEWV